MNKVLLIIDVQNDYFKGGKMELKEIKKNLKKIEKAIIKSYYIKMFK